MTVQSVTLSIMSMMSSCTKKELPEDNEMYVSRCRPGQTPKDTSWYFHDDRI